MILLHSDNDARARVKRIVESAAGDVFCSAPGDNPSQIFDKVSAWLNTSSEPEIIVIDPANANNDEEREVFESLRRIVKFKGVDMHFVGDTSLADIADKTVERDEDLELVAPGSTVGAQIARLQQSEVMTEFEKVEMDVPTWQDIVASSQCTEQEARAEVQWRKNQSVWANGLYQVNVEYLTEGRAHIIVRRLDKQPVHNWQHMQQIKTAVLGPECEAVELYPKESQLVDEKHHYHMWAFRSPERSFGIGFRVGRKLR